MNRTVILLFACVLSAKSPAKSQTAPHPEGIIRYQEVTLSEDEKQILEKSLSERHTRYDADAKMLTRTLDGYNYHTDAESGVFHEVRSSFRYALELLDVGDKQYEGRAFDILEKLLTLQDTDTSSRTCGVWPYYMEEPLATKKSPVDFNWADFNAVSLLDVYMGHEKRIPPALKQDIQKSIVLAARSIQKRNVGPGYTNIALMGTYVTFMTAHLFDIPDMKTYAANRLLNFYKYTLEHGGFTEYNSPTYTIVALDEINRMQTHIIDPEYRAMIDSLYSVGWDMISRHYHKPTGQWAGPHSRSYSSLVEDRTSFRSILKQASAGRIGSGNGRSGRDPKIKHTIPEYLMHYFLSPQYPRTETDVFEFRDPRVVGTAWLTDRYAISSVNRSSLWNQRRPFLVYWGSIEKPHYLQVRFLHDGYDFSAASMYCDQKENKILAGINFVTDGGDKHISIDRLKDGKFRATDLRLRFEIGNFTGEGLPVPQKKYESFDFVIDKIRFNLQLCHAAFGKEEGYWEKGGDGHVSWIDYVMYAGVPREFDLSSLDEAVLGFTFSVDRADKKFRQKKPALSLENRVMDVQWQDLRIWVPVKPLPRPANL